MPKPDFSIDEPSYQEGRAAFTSGASVRSIIGHVQASVVAGTFDDDKVLSSAIGFVDALLDHLRKPKLAESLTAETIAALKNPIGM